MVLLVNNFSRTKPLPDITIADAQKSSLEKVAAFLQPYMDQELLLQRTREELQKLLKHGFIASCDDGIVGFAAVEIYSPKLAEVQCLAVAEEYRGNGIGRMLVARCVQVAGEQGIKELMAISASEAMFVACGFDYSLPNQKRALFISPKSANESGTLEQESSQD